MYRTLLNYTDKDIGICKERDPEDYWWKMKEHHFDQDKLWASLPMILDVQVLAWEVGCVPDSLLDGPRRSNKSSIYGKLRYQKGWHSIELKGVERQDCGYRFNLVDDPIIKTWDCILWGQCPPLRSTGIAILCGMRIGDEDAPTEKNCLVTMNTGR
jgi:hypothetical protein